MAQFGPRSDTNSLPSWQLIKQEAKSKGVRAQPYRRTGGPLGSRVSWADYLTPYNR